LPRSKLTQKPNAGCAPGPGKEVQTTHADIMSAALQFAADSAQEMRIPVVAAGCDCMHEIDDFHATASILPVRSEQ
jgi:hypothetical protein